MNDGFVTIRNVFTRSEASFYETVLRGHGFDVLSTAQSHADGLAIPIQVLSMRAHEADTFLDAVLRKDASGQLSLVGPGGGELSLPSTNGHLSVAAPDTLTHCPECNAEWEVTLGACWNCTWQPALSVED